jgi:hypothetical protein
LVKEEIEPSILVSGRVSKQHKFTYSKIKRILSGMAFAIMTVSVALWFGINYLPGISTSTVWTLDKKEGGWRHCAANHQVVV